MTKFTASLWDLFVCVSTSSSVVFMACRCVQSIFGLGFFFFSSSRSAALSWSFFFAGSFITYWIFMCKYCPIVRHIQFTATDERKWKYANTLNWPSNVFSRLSFSSRRVINLFILWAGEFRFSGLFFIDLIARTASLAFCSVLHKSHHEWIVALSNCSIN